MTAPWSRFPQQDLRLTMGSKYTQEKTDWSAEGTTIEHIEPLANSKNWMFQFVPIHWHPCDVRYWKPTKSRNNGRQYHQGIRNKNDLSNKGWLMGIGVLHLIPLRRFHNKIHSQCPFRYQIDPKNLNSSKEVENQGSIQGKAGRPHRWKLQTKIKSASWYSDKQDALLKLRQQ